MSRPVSFHPATPDGTSLLHEAGDVLELGVLSVDTERNVVGWNRWLELASGKPAAQVLGRRLDDVYPEIRGTYGDRALTRVLSGATVVMAHRFHEHFLPFPPPPGVREFDLMQQSVRMIPRIEDGEVVSAIVFIEDVSERVAREAELFHALHRAEAANRAKGDFLATMSHELRTPLAAITGYADLMLQEMAGPLTDGQGQHVARMKNLSAHLLRIVDEILTFSRLQAGREEVHIQPVDLSAVAREAALSVQPLITRKGLEFRVSIPDLPVTVPTDEMKVTQILINLLGNAAKFAQSGEVSLTLQPEPDRVRFDVADTGPGISPANCVRIFEPFTQVETALRRREPGTGLGLPVSRQLARLLGGDVTVSSTPGRGSIFTLTLPRDAVAPSASAE